MNTPTPPHEAEQALEFLAGAAGNCLPISSLTAAVISPTISFSAVALMEADAVLQMVNCDLKSSVIWQASYRYYRNPNGR